jgi:hypothetical protein
MLTSIFGHFGTHLRPFGDPFATFLRPLGDPLRGPVGGFGM